MRAGFLAAAIAAAMFASGCAGESKADTPVEVFKSYINAVSTRTLRR
jgi:hypothetical protein